MNRGQENTWTGVLMAASLASLYLLSVPYGWILFALVTIATGWFLLAVERGKRK